MSRQNHHPDGYEEPALGIDVERAKELVFVLLRYRWLVAATFVGVLAITCIATLLQTPQFKASALLRVDRGKLNLVEDHREDDRWLGSREFYGTQRRVLTSRSLAERTLDRLDAWSSPLLEPRSHSGDDRKDRLDAFLSMLQVAAVRNTQLLQVSVISPDPAFARDLSNAHTREYISYVSEAESGVAQTTSSFLREQIEKLQREILEKEMLLKQYGEQQDIVVEQSDEIIAQQLSELHHELTLAQGELATAQARYRSLQQSDPASSAVVFNNPTIQRLRQELSTLEKEYAELGMKFEPKWPEMQRKQRAIEETESRLESETKDLSSKLVASARADFQAATNRVAILKKTLEQQRRESRDLSAHTSDYNRVRVELESQRAMLEQLTRREGETGLSADLDERQHINVGIVEEAVLPGTRFKPSLVVNLSVGGLIGGVLALALAFFVNFWDTSIHNTDDLRRYAEVPCLATIPHFVREKELPAGSNRRLPASTRSPSRRTELVRSANSVTKHKPGYPHMGELLERFKFLRNSLLLSSPGNPPTTVLVTSGSEREGKSFVAANFASSYAQLGKRVLLIDADLRRPSAHKFFGMQNKSGLTNVIIGQTKLTEGCIQQTTVPNLYVLPSGPQSPSPAELLSSKAMQSVIAQCSQHFDMVVLDSAPLFPVVDSHALGIQADASLLVVRSASTKGPAVKNALELLTQAQAKVAGIVLNDIDLMDFAQSYYYRHYSYGYAPNSYQDQARA